MPTTLLHIVIPCKPADQELLSRPLTFSKDHFTFNEIFQKPLTSSVNVGQQLYYNMYCSVYVGSAFRIVFPHWFVVRFDIKGTK